MISIIDSGYGGLSIVAELLAQEKKVPFIYLGDNARNPYGTRTKTEILQYGKEMIDYLIAHFPIIDTIIIACNTLCAAGLDVFDALYPRIMIVPITRYGCLSAMMSFDKHVSVLATTFTVKSNFYAHCIHQYDASIIVQQLNAQPLVQMVETQQIDRHALQTLVQKIDQETDTLILGCTHFPFLHAMLREVLSENILIVDPAVSCVADLAASEQTDWQEHSRYLTTGTIDGFANFVNAYQLPQLPIEQVQITEK